MSALNPTIFTLKNPLSSAKESKELYLTENIVSQVEIPAHLLQRAIQTCDTKTELTVYMTILRYSLGFNRDSCTVSRRFISKWSGLQFQNVGRGIEGLIDKGLIEKLSESNAKHGDAFKVLHISEAFCSAKPPLTRNQNDYAEAIGCNQSENTQGVINVITESNQSDDAQSSKRLRSVITLITKNKIEDLEKSSSTTQDLKKYIQSLSELHHQKIERKCLQQLLENYTATQIQMALAYAQKEGTTAGDNIKLPLCYLARGSSMETILKVVEKRQAVEQSKLQILDLTEKHREFEAQKERKSEENFKQALNAFEEAHPSQESQNRVITEIIQSRFKSLNPAGKTAKSIAILHWFKNSNEAQLQFCNEGAAL